MLTEPQKREIAKELLREFLSLDESAPTPYQIHSTTVISLMVEFYKHMKKLENDSTTNRK